MATRVNYTCVSTWLQQCKHIQIRKYYTLSQLYTLFKNELKKKGDEGSLNLITTQAFSRHLNSIADLNPLFCKVNNHLKRLSQTTYILIDIKDVDVFLSNTLQISPQKTIISKKLLEELQHPSPSKSPADAPIVACPSKQPADTPSPSRPPVLVPSPSKQPADAPSPSRPPVLVPSPSKPQLPTTIAQLNEAASPNSTSPETVPVIPTPKSQVILNLQKSDFQTSLQFFMGKTRAEEICNSESNENSDDLYSCKVTVKTHILKQIEKLTHAYVTVNGWKNIICDFDNEDVFPEHAVFDYRLIAFYLQKLYSISLRYYNSISDFHNIAALAIVEANSHLGVLPNKELQHFSNPASLLRIFRMYCVADALPNKSKLRHRKSQIPFFLSENPDSADEILSYCKTNLATLGIEGVHAHIHNIVLPNLVKKNVKKGVIILTLLIL